MDWIVGSRAKYIWESNSHGIVRVTLTFRLLVLDMDVRVPTLNLKVMCELLSGDALVRVTLTVL